MPRFFFSYAHANAENSVYVTKFFKELCREVADLTGEPAEEVGFRDTSGIHLGEAWPVELVEALSTCQAFVALYSPDYFDSETCGKEWAVFAGRVRTYQERSALVKRPALILPVLWIEPRRDQTVPREVQYTHEEFGRLYAERGLKQLMALGARSEYRRFVAEFARRLVEVTTRHPLSMLDAPPALRTVRSAFLGEGPPAGRASSAAGPLKVWFIIVAGTRDELARIPERTILDAYGDKHEWWQPYAPTHPGRLVPRAQVVAGEAGLESMVCIAGKQLAGAVREANRRNEIAVLFVDAWTLRLGDYHDHVKAFDELNVLNSAVLIAWNANDSDTATHANTLRVFIHSAFANNYARRDRKTFHPRVPSLDHLLEQLGNVIQETQRRVIERADVARRVNGHGDFSLPALGGPLGPDT